MEGKMRVMGFLTCGLWAVGVVAGEISSEVRERRQTEGSIEDRRVVCYYANWAVYRKGDAQFTPQNINPYLCTHLIYAFGGLGKDDTLVPFDEYQDIEKGGYGRFAALKTYNKDLKTMLAIGGWNEGSRRFSPMVEDPARRQVFIKSALRFLRQYNFDGVDLDWEYPTLRAGGRPQDKANYATFIEEMREAFEAEASKTKKERLLISMAVPASLEYAGQGYAIDRLDNALDFFNLLTYDYHSAHEPAVNHHSPLYRPDDWSEYDFRKDLNIDATIRFYLDHGASRHKLVLGIPTYGRSYTLANPDAHEIGSPTVGPGEKGEGTKEDGYLAYYEICQKVLEEGWELETQYPGYMGPYAHKGDQWVGFDDVDIAVEKAFYVAEEELGGIMFWTIDNDDFRGTCSKTPYPLIESAKEAMYSVESSVKTTTSVQVSTSERQTRTRLRLTEKELANLSPRNESAPARKQGVVRPPPPKSSRKEAPRSLGGPQGTTTTPAPPTTPSNGPAFKCRAEGFFPHATSCKKYFWCLDTPNQGMVAHTFSCPQGLYFNEHSDGCDFLRNVNCGDKDTTEVAKAEGTEKEATANGADVSESDDEDTEEEDPKSLKDILELVKAAGGVEGLEKQIEDEAEQKKEEEERKQRISTKTRNRLTQLLKGRQREAEGRLSRPSAQNSLETLARTSPSETPSTQPPTTRRNLSRNSSNFRNRNIRPQSSSRRVTPAPRTTRPPRTRNVNLFRNRFRTNPISRATPAPSTTLATEDPIPTLDPESADESNKKIQIVGAHLEPEEPKEEPLHLGVFKPKDGIREKLRATLHNVLLEGIASRPQGSEGPEQSTLSPLSTVTISKNTRIEGDNIGRARETVRGFASRRREQNLERVSTTGRPQDSNRYVTIQRGRGTTAEPEDVEDKARTGPGGDSEYLSSQDFRPTVADVLVPTETPVPAPTTTSTPVPETLPPVIITTTTTATPVREQPRRLDIFNVRDEEEQPETLSQDLDREIARDADNNLRGSHDARSQSITESLFGRSRGDNLRASRPFVGRPLRPVPTEAPNRPRGLSRARQPNNRAPNTRAPITRAPNTRAPNTRAPQTRAPQTRAPNTRSPASTISLARAPFVSLQPEPVPADEKEDFEYEYYYDYLEDEDSRPNTEYDLVPLANKVRILEDGLPHCFDVGVFPHPFSCKKFINCFRNPGPGQGIQGSIYQCPSYLAFDPVGGRCNWVNEIVCASGSQARRRY